MEKPCQFVHGDFQEGCGVCRKWRDDPRYAKHRTAAGPIKAKANPVLPCTHRGEPTGQAGDCQTCTGRVSLKVFACTAHPEGCTLGKKVDGYALCESYTSIV